MLLSENAKFGKRFFRVTSLVTALVFLANNVPVYSAAINPASFQTEPQKELQIDQVAVPSELGKIEEIYKASENSPVVVLIQNAHAIADAQKNIQKLIGHFQKQYGLSLVGVEGASSALDAQIFRSFPDKGLLQKVFAEYLEKEELTGTVASAIFNEGQSVYQGVEDWQLYEMGLGLYTAAVEKESALLEKFAVKEKDLQSKKEAAYSKELLEVDRALQSFRENHNDLIQILKTLAKVKSPEKGTELALLVEESEKDQKNQTPIELEVKKIAAEIQVYLKTQSPSEKNKKNLTAFHQKYQEFQTSRLSAEAFALFLQELTYEDQIPIKASNQLSHLMTNQKRMRDIEGTKLFKDLEHYVSDVKAGLFRNEQERKLDRESRQLEILERLVRLELNREDWKELKGFVQSNSIIPDESLKAHLSFYENAAKRDEAFSKNLISKMTEKKAHSALLVAGGFHTEGLTQRLKEKGISYLLLMPQIGSVPQETHYREHMKGEVSWKAYFEVENGKINFYKAFVRSTRDRLLRQSNQESAGLLKAWRDQIIRDLAKQERVATSNQYTSFIDEMGREEQRKSLTDGFQKIDEFVERLRGLDAKGQLTGQNVLKLLKPATIEDLAGNVNLSGDPIPYSIDIAGIGSYTIVQTTGVVLTTKKRSEARLESISGRPLRSHPEKALVVFSDVHSTLLYEAWLKEAEVAYQRIQAAHGNLGITDDAAAEWVQNNILFTSREDVVSKLKASVQGGTDQEARKYLGEAKRAVENPQESGVLLKPIPGAFEFLQDLKAKGVPIVIMSGESRESIVNQLRATGLIQFLDEKMIFGRGEMMQMMPSGQPYDRDLALETIYRNNFDGTEAVHFNDWRGGQEGVRRVGGINVGLLQGIAQAKGRFREVLTNEVKVDFILDGGYPSDFIEQLLPKRAETRTTPEKLQELTRQLKDELKKPTTTRDLTLVNQLTDQRKNLTLQYINERLGEKVTDGRVTGNNEIVVALEGYINSEVYSGMQPLLLEGEFTDRTIAFFQRISAVGSQTLTEGLDTGDVERQIRGSREDVEGLTPSLKANSQFYSAEEVTAYKDWNNYMKPQMDWAARRGKDKAGAVTDNRWQKPLKADGTSDHKAEEENAKSVLEGAKSLMGLLNEIINAVIHKSNLGSSVLTVQSRVKGLESTLNKLEALRARGIDASLGGMTDLLGARIIVEDLQSLEKIMMAVEEFIRTHQDDPRFGGMQILRKENKFIANDGKDDPYRAIQYTITMPGKNGELYTFELQLNDFYSALVAEFTEQVNYKTIIQLHGELREMVKAVHWRQTTENYKNYLASKGREVPVSQLSFEQQIQIAIEARDFNAFYDLVLSKITPETFATKASWIEMYDWVNAMLKKEIEFLEELRRTRPEVVEALIAATHNKGYWEAKDDKGISMKDRVENPADASWIDPELSQSAYELLSAEGKKAYDNRYENFNGSNNKLTVGMLGLHLLSADDLARFFSAVGKDVKAEGVVALMAEISKLRGKSDQEIMADASLKKIFKRAVLNLYHMPFAAMTQKASQIKDAKAKQTFLDTISANNIKAAALTAILAEIGGVDAQGNPRDLNQFVPGVQDEDGVRYTIKEKLTHEGWAFAVQSGGEYAYDGTDRNGKPDPEGWRGANDLTQQSYPDFINTKKHAWARALDKSIDDANMKELTTQQLLQIAEIIRGTVSPVRLQRLQRAKSLLMGKYLKSLVRDRELAAQLVTVIDQRYNRDSDILLRGNGGAAELQSSIVTNAQKTNRSMDFMGVKALPNRIRETAELLNSLIANSDLNDADIQTLRGVLSRSESRGVEEALAILDVDTVLDKAIKRLAYDHPKDQMNQLGGHFLMQDLKIGQIRMIYLDSGDIAGALSVLNEIVTDMQSVNEKQLAAFLKSETLAQAKDDIQSVIAELEKAKMALSRSETRVVINAHFNEKIGRFAQRLIEERGRTSEDVVGIFNNVEILVADKDDLASVVAQFVAGDKRRRSSEQNASSFTVMDFYDRQSQAILNLKMMRIMLETLRQRNQDFSNYMQYQWQSLDQSRTVMEAMLTATVFDYTIGDQAGNVMFKLEQLQNHLSHILRPIIDDADDEVRRKKWVGDGENELLQALEHLGNSIRDLTIVRSAYRSETRVDGVKVGAELHADWQKTFRKDNPTKTDRWKPAKPTAAELPGLEAEIAEKSTTARKTAEGDIEIDILNRNFGELTAKWQGENGAAGLVVAEVLESGFNSGLTLEEMRNALASAKAVLDGGQSLTAEFAARGKGEQWIYDSGNTIHSRWLGRNSYVLEKDNDAAEEARRVIMRKDFGEMTAALQVLDINQLAIGLEVASRSETRASDAGLEDIKNRVQNALAALDRDVNAYYAAGEAITFRSRRAQLNTVDDLKTFLQPLLANLKEIQEEGRTRFSNRDPYDARTGRTVGNTIATLTSIIAELGSGVVQNRQPQVNVIANSLPGWKIESILHSKVFLNLVLLDAALGTAYQQQFISQKFDSEAADVSARVIGFLDAVIREMDKQRPSEAITNAKKAFQAAINELKPPRSEMRNRNTEEFIYHAAQSLILDGKAIVTEDTVLRFLQNPFIMGSDILSDEEIAKLKGITSSYQRPVTIFQKLKPALLNSYQMDSAVRVSLFQILATYLTSVGLKYIPEFQTSSLSNESVQDTVNKLEKLPLQKPKYLIAAIQDKETPGQRSEVRVEGFASVPGTLESRFMKVIPEIAKTDRQGQEGRDTLRLFEIHDVTLDPVTSQTVLDRIKDPKYGMYLVAEDQIRNWKTGKIQIPVGTDAQGQPIYKEATIANNAAPLLDETQVGENWPQDVVTKVTTDNIRISSAGLARILMIDPTDGQKKYLLVLNKDASQTGKYKLAPFGGAVGNISVAGLNFLTKTLGVDPNAFEGVEKAVKKAQAKAQEKGVTLAPQDLEAIKAKAERDLRFTLSKEKLSDYINWFLARKDREIDASRELGEELVDEQDVFTWPEWTWLSGQFAFDKYATEAELYQDLRKHFVAANGEEAGVLLDKAHALAAENHAKAKNAIRDDKRQYIFHVLEIAYHLVLGLGITDRDTVLAAILHDLPEDTPVTFEQIKSEFGNEVELIVRDLTENTEYRTNPALIYRSTVGTEYQGRLATKIEHVDRVEASNRVSSIVLKVVDRLQNLLTNESPKNQKQRRMEISEIDRWMKFLEHSAIPQTLKDQILPSLDRERRNIEEARSETRVTADQGAHDFWRRVESKNSKLLNSDGENEVVNKALGEAGPLSETLNGKLLAPRPRKSETAVWDAKISAAVEAGTAQSLKATLSADQNAAAIVDLKKQSKNANLQSWDLVAVGESIALVGWESATGAIGQVPNVVMIDTNNTPFNGLSDGWKGKNTNAVAWAAKHEGLIAGYGKAVLVAALENAITAAFADGTSLVESLGTQGELGQALLKFASAIHEEWMANNKKEGWNDNLFVPFAELPTLEQLKDINGLVGTLRARSETRTISAAQVNFGQGIAVVSNASKFVLPIPAFSKEEGEMLVYPAGQEKAGQQIVDWQGKPIGDRGVVFLNAKDNSVQAVQGDGNGVIIINQVTQEQAKLLMAKVAEYKQNPMELTLGEIKGILAFAAEELGLVDMYNSDTGFISKKMSAIAPAGQETRTTEGQLWGYVKRDDRDVSVAVFIKEPHVFEGPAATPQVNPNGAVIIKQGDSIRSIQPDIFEQTYRRADGASIQVNNMPVLDIARSETRNAISEAEAILDVDTVLDSALKRLAYDYPSDQRNFLGGHFLMQDLKIGHIRMIYLPDGDITTALKNIGEIMKDMSSVDPMTLMKYMKSEVVMQAQEDIELVINELKKVDAILNRSETRKLMQSELGDSIQKLETGIVREYKPSPKMGFALPSEGITVDSLREFFKAVTAELGIEIGALDQDKTSDAKLQTYMAEAQGRKVPVIVAVQPADGKAEAYFPSPKAIGRDFDIVDASVAQAANPKLGELVVNDARVQALVTAGALSGRELKGFVPKPTTTRRMVKLSDFVNREQIPGLTIQAPASWGDPNGTQTVESGKTDAYIVIEGTEYYMVQMGVDGDPVNYIAVRSETRAVFTEAEKTKLSQYLTNYSIEIENSGAEVTIKITVPQVKDQRAFTVEKTIPATEPKYLEFIERLHYDIGYFGDNEGAAYGLTPDGTAKRSIRAFGEFLLSGAEVRNTLLINLTDAITGLPTAINEAEADQVVVYVQFNGYENLKEALKQALIFKNAIRQVTSATIADTVWREELTALINTLKLPTDSKTPELKGTIGLVLPKELSGSFTQNFVKALAQANIDTVAVVGKGKVADEITRAAKTQGSNVRPLKNLNELTGEEVPVPTGILDQLISQIPEGLVPFWIDMKDVNDPLVQDYAEQLQIVSLVHAARILATHPNPQALLKDRELLRAELLKSLTLFGQDSTIIVTAQGRPGFIISGIVAKAYLEHRSELRVKQAA